MRARALPLLLCVLALFAWGIAAHALYDRQLVTIEVGLEGESVIGTQVFFASANDFSERNSKTLREEGSTDWRFRIPAERAATLRVDPPAGSRISVCRLSVVYADGHRQELDDYTVSGSHQISGVVQRNTCMEMTPAAGSDDPQVSLTLASGSVHRASRAGAVGCALAGLLSAVAAWLLFRRIRRVPPSPGDWFGRNLVRIYVLLSLGFGFAYAVITPPGAVTDEYAHVTKAVKLSSGVLVGSTGDRQFPNIYEMYGAFNGYLDPGVHFSAAQLLAQLETPVPCTPTTAALPSGADSYAPHLYIAPAASYAFSCATGGDTGTFLLLARLGNLLLATALIAIGLWATLRARWALFVCALLPMTLYQLASVSADAMYIALSFAWIGAVCGVIEGRIRVQNAVWLLGPLAIALAISKPGAAWVLSAILFARPQYLRTVGTFVPALLKFLILPFVVHLIWVLYAAGSAAPLEGVDPAANIARIGSDPFGVAKLFLGTFLGTHGIWLWKSAMGVLGWLDVFLSPLSYAGLTFCLLASLFMGAERDRLPTWSSVTALVFAGGAALMLALPLFIFWTFPQSTYIMGLQGRYFLPCIAFAVCFLARGTDTRVRVVLSVLVPLILMFTLADGLVALVERYYP